MPKFSFDLTRGNYKLKRVLNKKHIRGNDMSAILGISYRSWVFKLCGKKPFTIADMMVLKKCLKLKPEEAWDIFFETEYRKLND